MYSNYSPNQTLQSAYTTPTYSVYTNKLLCFVIYAQQWGIFVRIEQNENGTEIVVVAYLDCIHEFVSITFIVFIRNITWSY